MTAPGVTRDRWGIPHVTGADLPEVARLQGGAAVEDRAWQLEHARRKAEGRLAEVLGPAYVEHDVLVRRTDLAGLARRAYDAADEETRALFAAYVDGVNGALPAASAPELTRLRVEPEPWLPWTPMAVFAAHHLLFATFPTKLWRDHVRRHLGPEVAPLFNDEGLWSAGSNSWVVGGERTRSGRPVIGGDPHRTFEAPNAYVQVRLTCPDEGIDVAGFTFPGVPGVQHFAHAGDVAWGITNAMGDYQDLYVERLERAGDDVRCAGPAGPEPVQRRTVIIAVRGADAVEVEALRTPRGPVVLDGPEPGTVLALRWPADVLGDLGLGAVVRLLRARTTADVLDACAGWVEPVNNLLAADVHGTVRQQVVGRVPRRPDANRWRPVPADDPGSAWDGWIDLPGRDVAPHEHLATANHRMPGFEVVGPEFAGPARARRLEALLEDADDVTAETCAAIHGDVLAGQPAALWQAIAALEADLSPAASALRDEISAWDQRLDAHSETAAAYVGVRDALVTRLAAAEPFAGLPANPHPAYVAPWFALPTQLYLSLANVWGPHGAEVVPDREAHLAAALEDVAARPRRTWGSRHRYAPFAPGGEDGVAAPELPGDNDCVRCAGHVPGGEVAVRGSVARYAWDLGGRHLSGWVVPRGAHGDPAHPHFADQQPAWLAADLLPLED